MKKIDNIVAGGIGFAVMAAFVIGLAETISTVPFAIIVALVVGMAGYDYYESCFKNGGDK